MGHGVDPDLFAFVTDPASHGLPEGAEIATIETHGSLIVLAGAEALKIYKAVRFDYLDYSTRDRRRAAAVRELELNRPHAPEIYLGLAEIRAGPNGPAFDGEGPVVETAVRMRRFSQDALLSAVAGRGELDGARLGELAETVARMHERAPPAAEAGAPIETVAAGALDGLEAGRRFLDGAALDALAAAMRQALARLEPLLAQRRRDGYVRRCHGDLHLGNLVVFEGRILPFDALEFDEALASIDVLYDLAFLLMDLIHRGFQPEANALLSGYAARIEPEALGGFAALPVFMALRAAIRARVALDRAAGLESGPARERAHEEARAYLAAALALIQTPQPRLIAIGGLSGSGKTTYARRLAPGLAAETAGPLGALHLRSDVERKMLAGVGELERLSPAHYTAESAAAVYARLRAKAKAALGAGLTVIVDAVHAAPAERAAIEAVAREAGAPFEGVWLEASEETLAARLRARTGDASDADEAVLARQQTYALGDISWRRLTA